MGRQTGDISENKAWYFIGLMNQGNVWMEYQEKYFEMLCSHHENTAI